jgi:hypothetical protein
MSKEFMSLSWFKEKVENSVERVLDERIAKKIDKVLDKLMEPGVKPYSKLKMVNNNLTVVLSDGKILTKPNATEEHYNRIRVADTKEEIIAIIEDREVAQEKEDQVREAKKISHLIDGFKLLGTLKDFTVEDNTVYLKGTSRSIPPLLVDKFTEVVGRINATVPSEYLEDALDADDEYQGLKNFFMWCCLNPRAEVAKELYRFLTENSFRITKQGFFVALRNVVTVASEDTTLVEFISNAYNKVKAVWKKNPKDYIVIQTKHGDYSLITRNIDNIKKSSTIIGGLKELYLDLPNMKENRFTDAWTGTFDIRVGQVVSMPISACNWSTQDCAAAGLHFTSDQIHYVGCGDTSVLVLINPMKVVGIGKHKGRCYEYLPIMTVPRDEATKILHDIAFDTLELDEDYAINELESLEEKAKIGFIAEATKYDFNIPSISSAELNSIVLSLSEMKTTITKRVNIID